MPHDSETVIDVAAVEGPEPLLKALRGDVAQWVATWTAYAQQAPGEGAEEVAQALAFLTDYLGPRLDQLAKTGGEERLASLQLMVPFDTPGGLRDCLLHFFQVAPTSEDGALVYEERDPFERDVFLLYDLYRVKKTLEVAAALREARADAALRFASLLDEKTIGQVLSSLEEVLGVLYAQCLSEELVESLIPALTPEMLSGAAVLERREEGILYTFPEILERYQYRKFFFMVFFKDGLKAKLGGKEREFRYSYARFQLLRHEYLLHWLTGPLKTDPRKYEAYQYYRVRGKTLLAWLSQAPEREAEILRLLPARHFNDLTSRVNEKLPPELSAGPVPQSESFGFYHELKRQLNQAVTYTRAPIEELRALVKENKPLAPPATGVDSAGRPLAGGKPAPAPAAAAAPAAPAKGASWGVSPLDVGSVPEPFFAAPGGQYRTHLGALKTRLGADYGPFEKLAAAVLEGTPETEKIKRFAPRHEWAVPFLIRRTLHGAEREYLLILGAEVAAKTRGMRVSVKEEHDFAPWFVFGALQDPEGSFGQPIGERKAGGQTFQEYAFTSAGVVKTVQELLKSLRAMWGESEPAA